MTWRASRDHEKYSVEQWRDLSGIALREDAVLVTTEKDMVRLPGAARDDGGHPPLVALRIEPMIHDEAVLLDRVEALL